MSKLKHILLATLGAGMTLACLAVDDRPDPSPQEAITDLIQRSHESNAALMRGDIGRYTALLTLAPDFTLMSPFGGRPTHGAPTREGLERIGRFFKNGTLQQEVVHAYGTRDMVVLALIERSRVEVGGLPSQHWALRVTLAYQREGNDWRLVHRHADPLVESVNLPQAAALARGERVEGG